MILIVGKIDSRDNNDNKPVVYQLSTLYRYHFSHWLID